MNDATKEGPRNECQGAAAHRFREQEANLEEAGFNLTFSKGQALKKLAGLRSFACSGSGEGCYCFAPAYFHKPPCDLLRVFRNEVEAWIILMSKSWN